MPRSINITRAKRAVFFAVLALACLAGILSWMLPCQVSPPLTVVFVGYTNKPGAVVTALLQVSNVSSVPVEIRPLLRAENVIETNGSFDTAPGYVSLAPGALPRTLPPGQAGIFDVSINSFSQPWRTEVPAYPLMDECLFRRITRGVTQPRIRGWIDRLSPPIGIQWIGLGPITDLPPGMARRANGEGYWR